VPLQAHVLARTLQHRLRGQNSNEPGLHGEQQHVLVHLGGGKAQGGLWAKLECEEVSNCGTAASNGIMSQQQNDHQVDGRSTHILICHLYYIKCYAKGLVCCQCVFCSLLGACLAYPHAMPKRHIPA